MSKRMSAGFKRSWSSSAARERARRRKRGITLESLEARSLLAVGPQLTSINPTDQTTLQNFDVLQTSPRELRFIFSQGQSMDPSTLDGIVVTRSGKDDSFEFAKIATDLNTQGAVVFQFTAVEAGVGGNSLEMLFRRKDLGTGGPVVTVSGRTIAIDLNSNAANPSKAGQVLQALQSNSLALELVSASILAGSPSTNVVDNLVSPTSVPLEGANVARVLTDMQSGGNVQIEFLARQSGPAGSGISVRFQHANLGTGVAPTVGVVGKQITVTLNSNSNTPTTAAGLISAIQGRPQANALIRAVQRAGASTADVASSSLGIPTLPLVGGTDVLITPGYVGVDTDRANEVIVRFAEKLPDDLYSIDILGAGANALQNIAGDPYDNGTNDRLLFQVDRGAQVVAVVPQPVSRDTNGQLVQTRNVIDVYFNDDDLNPASAMNRRFYRLIRTEGTVTNTDDMVLFPTEVQYDAATDRARLIFGSDPSQLPGGDGIYRLRIGTDEEFAAAPTRRDGVAETTVMIPVSAGPITSVPLTFTAVDDFGIAPRVQITATDFGGAGLPRVTVTDNTIRIELNSNAGNVSTVDQLIQAVAASREAAARVVASTDATSGPVAIGQAIAGAPVSLTVLGIGSSFATATNVGVLGGDGFIYSDKISTQFFPLEYPGGSDDPGHRDLIFNPHLELFNEAADQVPGISTITYNFRDLYGRDPGGAPLFNVITENQKQRAREVFDLYGTVIGAQFVEIDQSQIGGVVAAGGATITIATGDIRAISASNPTGPGGAVFDEGTVLDSALNVRIPTIVLDAAESWNDAYGGNWMEIFMRAVGNVLSIESANELPPSTVIEETSQVGERVFPSDHDIVHAQHVFRPESNDIDMYRFQVSSSGQFTAEILAERLADPSSLDASITLYRQNSDGSREVIARNEDYYSEDAYLSVDLEIGSYFLAVSSRGNDLFDPNVENSGSGGVTQGEYELRMHFRDDADLGIVDATGTLLDGDSDGVAGGVYNTWFQSASVSDTLFVDKSAAAGGNGSLATPFRTISAAFAASQPGDVVRIVGNGGADGNLATLTDNRPFEVGFNSLGQPLADGAQMTVPRGVTVMIDAGAVFKMRLSSIIVGSTSPSVDRSRGVLQVLGTPVHNVSFTSLNDETIGLDSSPFVTVGRAGDWGGLEFRNDVDRKEGRLDAEAQGLFLNTVNFADIRYGGGSVLIDSQERVIAPIQMVSARPTVANNAIRFSADAAMSASPNSFEETNFHSTDSLGVDYQAVPFTSDYSRVGPNIHDNHLFDNSVNGLFVSVQGSVNGVLETMTVAGRWDDADIVHVVGENLVIAGGAGGLLLPAGNTDPEARRDARLSVDPGVVVKLDGTRIEVGFSAQFIAEGSSDAPIVFTSTRDDRFGAGGTFDTTPRSTAAPEAGTWSGIYASPTSSLSLDYAQLHFAGGVSSVEGTFAGFNAVEVHQARARIAHTRFESNADGVGGLVPSSASDRAGRGPNDEAVIFVRGAQPVLWKNTFVSSVVRSNDNGGSSLPAISINVNALNHQYVRDLGRQTNRSDSHGGSLNNQGPLVRGNRFSQPAGSGDVLLGMFVRGEVLTTESVWDDTDITHIVAGDIISPDFHTYGGLRLQSAPGESLVVKLGQPSAQVSFSSASYATSLPTTAITAGDLNGDGNADLAVATTGTSVEVLLNQGTGTFGASTSIDVGNPVRSIDAGDMDADGDIDLVVGTTANVLVLINDGAGLFTAGTGIPPGGAQLTQIELADLDGDQDLDVAVAFAADPNISIITNDGMGALNTGSTFPAATGGSLDLDAGDVDGDGDLDLVVAKAAPVAAVALLVNDGTGSFGGAILIPTPATAQSVVLADLNGNGSLDLGVGSAGQVFVSLGNGDATFGAFQANPVLSNARDIDAVDINGDGTLDLVTSNAPAGVVSILQGAGDGSIESTSNINAGGGAGLVLTDVDRDGDSDIGVATGAPRVSVLYNGRSATGGGGFLATGQPLENDDRIGGRIQIVGQPGSPVILTSLADDTVGSGFLLDGTSVTDTNADGNGTAPTPGEWGGITLGTYSHDRNVEIINETEAPDAVSPGTNGTPLTAQPLGQLARSEKAGDENRRLGFEIHGFLTAGEADVYSFQGTAGTEVFLDVDRTSGYLDSVVELISSTGQVLASSDSSYREEIHPSELTGSGSPLQRSSFVNDDFRTTNVKDPGMRVTLPGAVGATNLYHIRIRMSSDGQPTSGPDRRLGGSYEFNMRLRNTDEISGSTIRYSDIRYATDAIVLQGQPGHSPLLGEIAETSAANEALDQAQFIGNVMTSDRGAVNLTGQLSSSGDVDWYRFDVRYDQVSSALSSPSLHTVSPLIFDVDYGDQLARPNTSIYLYDGAGNLIFFSQDSNAQADLTTTGSAFGIQDLSRGSLGTKDAFLGPISLRNGTYFMAVSSSARVPDLLADTGVKGTGALTVRTEPITSVNRVAEDRIGAGQGAYELPQVPLLIDDSSVVNYHLGDVALYVSTAPLGGPTQISLVDPFTGSTLSNNETLTVGSFGREVRDIAMRHSGTLFGYGVDLSDGDPTDEGADDYLQINTEDATITQIGDHGVETLEGAVDDMMMPACEEPPEESDVGIHVEGITYGLFGSTHRGFFVGNRADEALPPCLAYNMNMLYMFDPDTGVATSAPATDRDDAGVTQSPSPGTRIVERGVFNTAMEGAGTVITGIAVLPSGQLFAVSNKGGLYRVNNPTGADQGTGMATFLGKVGTGNPSFTGLVAGPANVEDGRYANMLFAIDATGMIRAFNTSRTLQNVFYNGTSSISTGIAGANGLAFSNLDFNLWHSTPNRNGDAGHGVDQPPDFTRRSAQGGTSYHFGYENRMRNGLPPNPALEVDHQDYNFPGGAHGSLMTLPFSLKGYEAADRPYFSFNYFLQTEQDSGDLGEMTDSFRVSVADASGAWRLMGTNNDFQGPFDEFDYNAGTVEISDVPGASGLNEWRHARIDLSQFAGRENLRIRFDFATAGSLNLGNVPDPNAPTLRTGGDELIAMDSDKIQDGDTFVIFRNGNSNSPVTFEFDLGHSLVIPDASTIVDGHTISITTGATTRQFEFDTDGVTGAGTIPVRISHANSPEAIAEILSGVIDSTPLTLTPHLYRNTINFEAATAPTVDLTGAPEFTLTGSPGIGPGRTAIRLSKGLPAYDPMAPDVVEAMLGPLASVFTNNVVDVIKTQRDTIRIMGHAVDNANTGPLGVSNAGGVNGIPGDAFGDVLNRTSLLNNAFEGAYVDDLLIGFTARGEMVSGATGGQTFVASPAPPTDITTGIYQIEIRPASDFTFASPTPPNSVNPFPDALFRSFDVRDRLVQGFALEMPAGWQIRDGETLRLGGLTLEFENQDLGNGVASGNVAVPYTTGMTAEELAQSFAVLVNSLTAQGRLPVAADVAVTGTRVDIHGPTWVLPVDQRLDENESNDTLLTAVDSRIPQGTTGTFRAKGIIGDNYVLDPFYNPIDRNAIRRALDVDMVRFELVAGQRLEIDIDAYENDYSDPVLRLFDHTGVELANSDDQTAPGESASRSLRDPYLTFVAPADGVYFVGISNFDNFIYDPNVPLSGLATAVSTGTYEIIAHVGGNTASTLVFNDRGDSNRFRDQGQLVIQANRISNSSGFGIISEAGSRDDVSGTPHPGSPQILREVNVQRLTRGAVIQNNLVVNNGDGAIRFSGTPGGGPDGAVPFGRIVNNTLHGVGGDQPAPGAGDDVGIQVENSASPTILNNIIANFDSPITIDGTSSTTVYGGNLYRRNTNDPYRSSPGLGSFDIDLDSPTQANKTLFINAAAGNFYLAPGSLAIDSSLDTLQDRPELVTVLNPLGILPSPILAPSRDLNGLLRVDDPTVEPPLGVGQNVFKDRGAIDRSDTIGPQAELVTPADNDPEGVDQDPAQNDVKLQSGPLSVIAMRLVDVAALGGVMQGSGIDDDSVDAADVVITRDGNLLVQGVDYQFNYDRTNNRILLVPLAGVFAPGTYAVTLDNAGIRDIAGNALQSNNTSGDTQFRIFLGQGIDFGDAPDPFPTRLTSTVDAARHIIEPGFFLGTGVNGESNGTPSLAATGDLGDDGVSFAGLLRQGMTVSMSVTSSGIGFVDGWIDFDQDQVWEPEEQILTSAAVTAGVSTFDVEIPAAAVLGGTFARFRLSREGGLGVTGLANNGEVEDYRQIISDPGIDFGDAPPPYPTTIANGGTGPSHVIVPGYFLGSTITPEDDGIPSANATGDTGDDGVTFNAMLVANSTTAVTIVASAAGRVDGWIDFNRDGDWDDAGEQVFSSQAVVAGSNALTVSTPQDAVAGTSFARFRFSSAGGLDPTGPANDGEVEDYSVTISPEILPDTFDFGDAPDPTFPTLLASDGARHVIVPGIFLGATISGEPDGQPSSHASADVSDDGITFSDLLAGNVATITVTASQGGQLDGWIDFNGDGDWDDAGEQVFDNRPIDGGANVLTITIPSDSFNGSVLSRFRFSSAGNLEPTGQALDGEVEDYAVTLIQPLLTWHNFSNPPDVDNQNDISPIDALLVINELSFRQSSDPITGQLNPDPMPPPFFDVNNDGFASPIDALLVINALPTSGSRAASSSSASSGLAPSPLLVAMDHQLRSGEWDDLAAPSLASTSLDDSGSQIAEPEVDGGGLVRSIALRAVHSDDRQQSASRSDRAARSRHGSEELSSLDRLFANWS